MQAIPFNGVHFCSAAKTERVFSLRLRCFKLHENFVNIQNSGQKNSMDNGLVVVGKTKKKQEKSNQSECGKH